MSAVGHSQTQAQDPAVERSMGAPTNALPSAPLGRTAVTVRPVQQSDVVPIQEMHARLSKESLYYRYLTPHPPAAADLQRLCFLDGGSGGAVVATVEGPQGQEKVVAMACYCVDPDDPTTAEPAVLVEDSYQGRGLGRQISVALCQHAHQRGVETFECFILPANHRVLRLIRGCGLPCESTSSHGLKQIRVWLKPVA
jgi:RimJ/RimL family protein N-acetyltransferase